MLNNEDLQSTINDKMIDEITIVKIEKAIDLICALYRNDLITDAYIVGSVAKGTSRKESDIDILIINPILPAAADIPPLPIILPYSQSEEEKVIESLRLNITSVLQNIGVEFKEISLKDIVLWYQLYKGEIFHIMPQNKYVIESPNIQITKDMCRELKL
jgi:predicted nucleotidyltransferase